MIISPKNQMLVDRLGERGVALRKKMAEFARPAALRLPPFDSLKMESGLARYESYLNKRDSEGRALLVGAYIKFMEFIIGGEICRDSDAIELWSKIDKEFQHDFMRNFVPIDARAKPDVSNTEARKIIIEQFKHELPNFSVSKSRDKKVLRFVTPNANTESVMVELDFGTLGPGHFTPYIGTESPAFTTELSAILCLEKRRWDFMNAEQCIEAARNVTELVRIILPLLDEKLTSVPSSRPSPRRSD